MKIDSHTHRPPETEMDSQEGYYLQFPNRIWNFKPDFCPKDWKYGSLGICSFFPAQKNPLVKIRGSAVIPCRNVLV
jgi:hypothetical protein